jgi:hypothetical protein
MRAVFERDSEDATAVDPAAWRRRPPWHEDMARAACWFAPKP